MEKEPLSACEAMIMKVIWDQKADVPVSDLMELIRVRFQKDYKRTTVATFLSRLASKGFVSTYRIGKLSYAHAQKSEEEYKARLAQRETAFWFEGRAANFIAALCSCEDLTKEDVEQIRRLLDVLDD